MTKIVAIDGPASVGKSTIGKILSRKYKSPILFSGKLYRAIALEVINQKISLSNIKEIVKCVSNINLKQLSKKELYSSEVDNISSIISAKKQLRNKRVTFQRDFPRNFCKGNKFAIIEGRDIGTVIFPKADYKIFLWAKSEVRAKRRYEQLKKNGKTSPHNTNKPPAHRGPAAVA